jgi:hypothetical protein
VPKLFDAVRSGFQLKIDIRVGHFISYSAVANDEEGGIFVREIQEMMSVPGTCWKANAGAGPDTFSTRVRHEHEFALEHVNEFILLRMRVTRRRLSTG